MAAAAQQRVRVMRNWDVYLTCPVTGAGATTDKSDKVPVTPKGRKVAPK